MLDTEAPHSLVLPISFDQDIKRRLSPEGLTDFIDSLDQTRLAPELLSWYKEILPKRYASRWTSTEVNYLLYGRQTVTGIISIDYYFDYYNFFHYVDTRDREESSRDDVCWVDLLMPHIHTYLYNPERNPNRGKKFIGTLHCHPHGGFLAESPNEKVWSPKPTGFSTPDIAWNNRYLKKYGRDGRLMAFLIYYQENGSYFGNSQTVNSSPQSLTVILE